MIKKPMQIILFVIYKLDLIEQLL